ncbi:MAG: TetR/AcrR family transcriptional regulator [Deltaproteobacteria bacterium]|nr:TetR/AcrR family transcriptional regulator [Deltaproteobacteria bacterium]
MNDHTVRQRLLAGAAELFARKGYASTTVREIVEAAKVTKPALYYYFRNKEGIYLELMREAQSRFEILLDSARKEIGAVKKRILSFSEQVFQLFLDQIEIARLGISVHYGPAQGAPFFDFDSFHLKFQDLIKQLIREGIRKGEFRNGNIMDMTWAVLGVINVAIEVQLWHPEKSIGRKGLVRILNLVFEGISSSTRHTPSGV